MTREDFARAMAFATAATDCSLSDPATEAYFELLGDLPADVLMASVKVVVLEHPWHTFPSVAEFRQAASEIMRGLVVELSPGEAWAAAWRAAGRIDLEINGSADRHLKDLPTLVLNAMVTFGVANLCYGKEPVSVLRAQFLKVYEAMVASERRRALLPGALTKQIEARGRELAAPVRRLITDLGKVPT